MKILGFFKTYEDDLAPSFYIIYRDEFGKLYESTIDDINEAKEMAAKYARDNNFNKSTIGNIVNDPTFKIDRAYSMDEIESIIEDYYDDVDYNDVEIDNRVNDYDEYNDDLDDDYDDFVDNATNNSNNFTTPIFTAPPISENSNHMNASSAPAANADNNNHIAATIMDDDLDDNIYSFNNASNASNASNDSNANSESSNSNQDDSDDLDNIDDFENLDDEDLEVDPWEELKGRVKDKIKDKFRPIKEKLPKRKKDKIKKGLITRFKEFLKENRQIRNLRIKIAIVVGLISGMALIVTFQKCSSDPSKVGTITETFDTENTDDTLNINEETEKKTERETETVLETETETTKETEAVQETVTPDTQAQTETSAQNNRQPETNSPVVDNNTNTSQPAPSTPSDNNTNENNNNNNSNNNQNQSPNTVPTTEPGSINEQAPDFQQPETIGEPETSAPETNPNDNIFVEEPPVDTGGENQDDNQYTEIMDVPASENIILDDKFENNEGALSGDFEYQDQNETVAPLPDPNTMAVGDYISSEEDLNNLEQNVEEVPVIQTESELTDFPDPNTTATGDYITTEEELAAKESQNAETSENIEVVPVIQEETPLTDTDSNQSVINVEVETEAVPVSNSVEETEIPVYSVPTADGNDIASSETTAAYSVDSKEAAEIVSKGVEDMANGKEVDFVYDPVTKTIYTKTTDTANIDNTNGLSK